MKKTIGYIIVLIFLCLLVGVPTLWWGKYKSFNELRAKTEHTRADFKNKEEYHSYLKDLSLKIEEKKDSFSKLNEALPEKNDLGEILSFLEKKSSQNGLILENIGIEKTVSLDQNSKIRKNSFSLSLIGTYDSFKSFILELQNSSRLPYLEIIRIKRIKEENVFSIDLRISFYSY